MGPHAGKRGREVNLSVKQRLDLALIKHGDMRVALDLPFPLLFTLLTIMKGVSYSSPNRFAGLMGMSLLGALEAVKVELGRLDSVFPEIIDGVKDADAVPSGQAEFFLLSLKHSPIDDYAMWWMPSDAGYTIDLEKAGRYTAAEIASRPGYYNSDSNFALPCEAVLAVAEVSRHVAWTTMKSWAPKGGAQ
jgi:hypothetical protein